MKKLFILSLLALTGCTTAGPFVTNISSDGKGGIIVEKSRIHYNDFTGTVSNKGSYTTKIQVVPESAIDKIEKMKAE